MLEAIFINSSISGLITSFLLPLKKKTRESIVNASLILIVSMILAFYVGIWNAIDTDLPWYFDFLSGFNFIIVPLLYCAGKGKLSRKDLIHSGSLILFFLWYSITSKIVLEIVLIGWVLGYFSMVIQDKSRSKSSKILFLSYVFTFLLLKTLDWFNIYSDTYDFLFVCLLSLAIYATFTHTIITKGSKPRTKRKPNKLNNKILNLVIEYLESEKAFLDRQLSMNKLSEALGLSTHIISESINGKYKGFYNLINQYRIDHAKKLLATTNLKIFTVALDSGFNNKMTFTKVFKKYTHKTPSEYRRKVAGENELRR